MGEKLVVGPINQGLRTDRLPFVIDNDSFPTLINAYQWRGRVKRKRGTSFLGRLTRFINALPPYGLPTVNLVGGAANIISGFNLEANSSLVPGSISIFLVATGELFTDNSLGVLSGSMGGTGTINYANGNITIVGGGASQILITILYFPGLPVMGLRDLILEQNQFPGTLAFDTKYSYNISTSNPYPIYNVSFYKNPPADGTNLPGYTPKVINSVTATTWNGQNYQQFWTVNYQGAFWATNGISMPFDPTIIGMQYYGPTTSLALTAATQISPTTVNFTVVGNTLVVGDFVFANEFGGGSGLNFQTGYVTAAGNTFTVTFPFATIAAGAYTPGILQLLTNRSNTTIDCIRWYDGDPTNGSATAPVLNGNNGWVNFMPPLSQGIYSIADLPALQYYLVGARMIIPFKDRLCFVGPVIQSSTTPAKWLRDTVIWCQNGTPYYTASYTNTPSATVDTPTSATNIFHPILVPVNQTATSPAYFEDQTGFGGFLSAGIDQALNTAFPNEDVIIMGFDRAQTRFVYTGSDINPFDFFLVNSELGSTSTFSGITMDQSVLTKGSRGYVMTNQNGCQRFDLGIPDQVFEASSLNNGTERVTAARDFINEWIYISYVNDQQRSDFYIFPTQTLQYNYRDDSWGVFNESYTCYGNFRRKTGLTWATLPADLTWNSWNTPWNSGASQLLQPEVICGNQEGFVIVRETLETGEGTSLAISAFSGNTVTVINHCLNVGDYLVISGCIGTIGPFVNSNIFSVSSVTDANTITLNPSFTSGTYLGGGLITRMYVPFIQTKQFPVSWGMGRKTRIGPQMYLFSKTTLGQVTLLIFLSQDSGTAYNNSPIVPNVNSINNSLIYSTVLYTCPESTNLGLTPANINLNMVTASNQDQIWHRMNTSLLGDTVQIGFTLSDAQMRDINFNNQFEEIELHAMILDLTPSMLLA